MVAKRKAVPGRQRPADKKIRAGVRGALFGLLAFFLAASLLWPARGVAAGEREDPLYSRLGSIYIVSPAGGSLKRTPAGERFVVANPEEGWRIKSFTIDRQGEAAHGFIKEVGYNNYGVAPFCWYSTSWRQGKHSFPYRLELREPVATQLGMSVQLWPGRRSSEPCSFYFSEIVLVNLENKLEHTLTFETPAAPAQPGPEAGGRGTASRPAQEEVFSLAELEGLLQRALYNRETSLFVRYRGAKENFGAEVERLLEEILQQDDYLRFSLKSRVLRWSEAEGAVEASFDFSYLASAEEERVVDALVADILEQILTPGMDEHQKLKAIHDYVVANVAYDLSRQEYSAYAALVRGRAVCQGYALLMQKMLREAGIPSLIVAGRAGGENHAWNMVRLGGNWYHIDATWNSPVPDVPGRVLYNYYIRSDEEMKATHSWDREAYPAAVAAYDRFW